MSPRARPRAFAGACAVLLGRVVNQGGTSGAPDLGVPELQGPECPPPGPFLSSPIFFSFFFFSSPIF